LQFLACASTLLSIVRHSTHSGRMLSVAECIRSIVSEVERLTMSRANDEQSEECVEGQQSLEIHNER
jgi:hypothetical protein